MEDALNKSRNWLLNSGIQNSEGRNRGGFNGWYDLDMKSYPFVYPETTGYGISTLLYFNSIRPDNILVKNAMTAASWIILKALHRCGGVRTRAYNFNPDRMYSFDSNVLYTFDNGMVLAGLVNLYKATRYRLYKDISAKIAHFLLAMQRSDGLFYAAYDANNSRRIDTPDKWSTQSGSYHAKLAIGLLDLYEITKNEIFREAAVKICEASVKFQSASGAFVTQQNEKSTHMHPHLYSCEGLAYAGARLDKPGYMKSSARGVEWALRSQLKSGGIPCKHTISGFIIHERSDTLAQALRLGTYMEGRGIISGYSSSLGRLASRLAQFQQQAGDHTGGFFYGTELDGTKRNHINSWCSMFAMQSLGMLKNSHQANLDFFV